MAPKVRKDSAVLPCLSSFVSKLFLHCWWQKG